MKAGHETGGSNNLMKIVVGSVAWFLWVPVGTCWFPLSGLLRGRVWFVR